jgi:mycobactin lysine-N-oxygenase
MLWRTDSIEKKRTCVLNLNQRTLAIIGAGPKGLAVGVKAKVLSEFGLNADHVVLIERHSVAAHWSGEAGYSNGELTLGTSPEKDLVFPFETDLGDEMLNRRVRQRLMDFSWSSFLMQTDIYSDWIDRGRPAPSHRVWADYMRWVSKKLSPEVLILNAEVETVDLNMDTHQWILTLLHTKGRETVRSFLKAEGLMLTGPGKTRMDFLQGFDLKQEALFDLESFWKKLSQGQFSPKEKIAVVGTGENAASILLALSKLQGDFKIDVISPKGFLATRSENYYENRFYSKPEECLWKDLNLSDRQDFIERTDLGVFSSHAMQILNEQRRHRIIPGRLIGAQAQNKGLSVSLRYGDKQSRLYYDQVILATGSDYVAQMKSLFSSQALRNIESRIDRPLHQDHLKKCIGSDLAVEGLTPKLYLPMLAGLMQGPGFSNLSCLGTLSDRVVLSSLFETKREGIENFQEGLVS